MAEDDITYVRAEAARRAWELHPQPLDAENRIDAFNDAVMACAVGRGTCDPNDVTKPWSELKGASDDNVHIAFTVDGIRFLYEQIERATILASPMREPASDADLLTLFDLLETSLPNMPPERAHRVRRMLSAVLEDVTKFAHG